LTCLIFGRAENSKKLGHPGAGLPPTPPGNDRPPHPKEPLGLKGFKKPLTLIEMQDYKRNFDLFVNNLCRQADKVEVHLTTPR